MSEPRNDDRPPYMLRSGWDHKPWWVPCPTCGAPADERCRDQRNKTPEKRPMGGVHPRRSILESVSRAAHIGRSDGSDV